MPPTVPKYAEKALDCPLQRAIHPEKSLRTASREPERRRKFGKTAPEWPKGQKCPEMMLT